MISERIWRLLAIILAGATFILIYVLARQPDGRVHMWLRPAEGGLIQTADGAYVLLDGGENPLVLSSFLGGHMSPLRWQLDLVIMTRWGEKRTAAQVEVLRRYAPHVVWYPPIAQGEAAQASWWDAVASAEVHPLDKGLQYRRGGVQVTVVSLEPLVLQVTAGRFVLSYTPVPLLGRQVHPLAGTTLWMTPQLPTTATTLPPFVLFAAPDNQPLPAEAVLSNPRTTFLPAAPTDTLALSTDGVAFHWSWDPR